MPRKHVANASLFLNYFALVKCGVTNRLARCASSIGIRPLRGIAPGAGHLSLPPQRLWQEFCLVFGPSSLRVGAGGVGGGGGPAEVERQVGGTGAGGSAVVLWRHMTTVGWRMVLSHA